MSTVNRPMFYCNRKKALIGQVFNVLHGLSPPASLDFFTIQIITHDLRELQAYPTTFENNSIWF